jgi:hypothetical protein
MHKIVLKTLLFTFLTIIVSPVYGEAQLFGADDEDLAKIEFELKKFNTSLYNMKDEELRSLHRQQEDMLFQIKEIKLALPKVQGAIENNEYVTNSILEEILKKLKSIEERLTVF